MEKQNFASMLPLVLNGRTGSSILLDNISDQALLEGVQN